MGQRYTHLFTRTDGSVTIRGYLTNFTMPKLPESVANCMAPFLGPRFVAEVSTPAAVGTSEGFENTGTDVLKSVSSSMIGQQEGSPTAVVIAYTGTSAATVRMTFATGQTDEMTPVEGWSVLAGPYPVVNVPGKTIGTLQALDSRNQTLKSMNVELGMVPLPENPVMGPACGCPSPAGGVTPGKRGGASTGGGVSTSAGAAVGGAVASGSGVASSGVMSSATTEVQEPAKNYVCPAVGAPATSPPSGANG
jgi:hypothetical protein